MSVSQKRTIIVFLSLMVFGSVCIDQITKWQAEENFMVWQSPTNLKEYRGARHRVFTIGDPAGFMQDENFYLNFNLSYVRNQGAAWGTLSELEDRVRVPFFYLVTLIAVCVIGFYLKSTPWSHSLARFALTLILSGALGNCLDRIRLGYVIDFLEFSWVIPLPMTLYLQNMPFGFLNMSAPISSWRYIFPNFNWADSMISIGIFFLLIDMIFLERKRLMAAQSSPTQDLAQPQ